MDANRNGVLEPGEVPEDRQRMLRFMAERAGFDPEKPIRLDQVRESLIRRYSAEEEGGRDQSREGDQDKGSDEPEPLVPGFGVGQELPRVPAFGERVDYASLMSGGASSNGSSSRSSSSRDRDRGGEDRVRRFADSMFARYDRNRNGVLERDEWGEMRVAQGADRNNDGKITKEELTARLAEYSGRRSRDEDGGDSGSGSSADSGSDSSGRDRSYRFSTAEELALSGLPGWFAECDANGDGQVAMAERYSDWTDAKAREFLSYDHNGDGLITQREALDGPTERAVPAGPAPGGPFMAGPAPGGPRPGGPGPGGPLGGPPAAKPASSPPTPAGGEKPWWVQ